MCPGALLGGDLPLRHHRHCLHHEADGHVLGRSLQVRTGACPVRLPLRRSWNTVRCGRGTTLELAMITLVTLLTGDWVFKWSLDWRRMHFYNLAWILLWRVSDAFSATLYVSGTANPNRSLSCYENLYFFLIGNRSFILIRYEGKSSRWLLIEFLLCFKLRYFHCKEET